MKSLKLIIISIFFLIVYSCNKQSENNRSGFIESQLFGKVKSIEKKSFENEILKWREIQYFTESGNIEKIEFYFEPNLSTGKIFYEYDFKNRIENETKISDGDTTFTYKYFYNSIGLIKKEEYYEKKLHSVNNFKLNSEGKIIEERFKYLETDAERTWNFYYPDTLTIITKESLKGIPDKETELKIYPKENKKVLTKNYLSPKSKSKEIFYHNNLGNLEKSEKYYNGKMTKKEVFKYELDSNKNWIKSENEFKKEERIITYYEN